MLLAAASASLGPLAMPVAAVALAVGFVCLVTAKWLELRAGHLVSFGPRRLSPARRKLYWLAYVVLSCGLLLAAFAVLLK